MFRISIKHLMIFPPQSTYRGITGGIASGFVGKFLSHLRNDNFHGEFLKFGSQAHAFTVTTDNAAGRALKIGCAEGMTQSFFACCATDSADRRGDTGSWLPDVAQCLSPGGAAIHAGFGVFAIGSFPAVAHSNALGLAAEAAGYRLITGSGLPMMNTSIVAAS
jgi:hypothetical protein